MLCLCGTGREATGTQFIGHVAGGDGRAVERGEEGGDVGCEWRLVDTANWNGTLTHADGLYTSILIISDLLITLFL
jgi:hypothetical protein